MLRIVTTLSFVACALPIVVALRAPPAGDIDASYHPRRCGGKCKISKSWSEHCPFFDDGERYSCDRHRASSVPRKLLPLLKRLGENNSTLWFIGDSLSGQYFDGLSCSAWAHGVEFQDAPSPLHTFSDHCREGNVSGAWFRICYISAGTGYTNDTSVMDTIRALDDVFPVSKGDILVINEGIWWRGTGRGIDEKSRVSALDLRGLEQNRGVKVFWRETLAQHFPTRNGSYGSWYLQGSSLRCAGVAHPQDLLLLNSEINSIIANQGVAIIPAFRSSLLGNAYRDHLELKTPHCIKRGIDCTHWCTPSGTFNLLIDVAIDAIVDSF